MLNGFSKDSEIWEEIELVPLEQESKPYQIPLNLGVESDPVLFLMNF